MKTVSLLFVLGLLTVLVVCPHQEARKKALIFGVTGQDGSYLVDFLASKNYEIHGVTRKKNLNNTAFIPHCGDLKNYDEIMRIIQEVQPDEVYNLAAQSEVAKSFEEPLYTGEIDALGTHRIVEAIRLLNLSSKTKFYQASTSELFGNASETPQRETTPFYPRSPYGVSKLYAFWIVKNYREGYKLFAVNGILYNHESPRRGNNYVSKKIIAAAVERLRGSKKVLYLGNLDSCRDWGYAPDYVEAMWLMLQQEKPDDYIIATGVGHTVRDFVEKAYKKIGIEIVWNGSGTNEIGKDKVTGEILVQVDPQFYRPTDVVTTIGDTSKATQVLGWSAKTDFDGLIDIMISSALQG